MSAFGATLQSGEQDGNEKPGKQQHKARGEKEDGGGESGWAGEGASHQEFDLMRTVTMDTASVWLLHVLRHSGGSDIFRDFLQLFDEVSS